MKEVMKKTLIFSSTLARNSSSSRLFSVSEFDVSWNEKFTNMRNFIFFLVFVDPLNQFNYN